MTQINIIAPAEDDIKTIYNYIKYHYKNKVAAEKFKKGLYSRINDLKLFPLQGVSYRKKYYRVKFDKYSIVYEYKDNIVTIIAVE